MFGALSILSVGLGSLLSFAVKLRQVRSATMEALAGALLLGGLGLLGAVLPHVS